MICLVDGRKMSWAVFRLPSRSGTFTFSIRGERQSLGEHHLITQNITLLQPVYPQKVRPVLTVLMSRTILIGLRVCRLRYRPSRVEPKHTSIKTSSISYNQGAYRLVKMSTVQVWPTGVVEHTERVGETLTPLSILTMQQAHPFMGLPLIHSEARG